MPHILLHRTQSRFAVGSLSCAFGQPFQSSCFRSVGGKEGQSIAGRHSARLEAASPRLVDMAVSKGDVEQNWSKRGFSFGVFVDPPGRVWPDFTHQTDELVMLTKGEFELSFNGKTIRPSIGEEVLIPAKVLHTVENVGSITNEWLYGYKRS